MKKLVRTISLLAVTAGFLLPQIGQLNAQSNALSITPRKDYTLRAGEVVNDTLTITNTNRDSPLQLRLSVVDFTAQDETGTPQLLRGETTQKTAWSLRDFIEMPEQVVVDAGATVQVPVVVRMGTEVGAGSYYSAIEYAAVNDIRDDQVNISASGVTLMFVKVPGQAREQLNFLQFGAFIPDPGGTGGAFTGLFFNDRPKVLAYRLKNEGNIAEQPKAVIVVKNSGGKEMYVIQNANPKSQIALLGQARRFDACISPETVQQTTDNGVEIDAVICGDTNFKPGRYTAELSVLYGENGNETREITAKATFWYLPWWFVGLVVAGIGLAVGVGFYIVSRVKNYRGRKTRRR
ncbi:hypothetical protein H0V99_02025 [Candidatus Saccharibacteria bacterium]|nr:hypothetical protein [Candidatus Saccharibacteria bacterium]